MLRFFLMVLDKYGIDVLQLSVVCYFGWKIMTNHLFHLKNQLNEICKKLENHDSSLNKITERIARIEGKIE